MSGPAFAEIPSDTLVAAALAGEPYDLPVSYDHMALGRENVVANRIAKNLGPLLGVPNPDGPFGEMSWLCDFKQLTLTEISRGAPEPTRAELKELRGTVPAESQDWQLVGRAVYGPTPNFIVNATMNKFEPDTKSGAVLTGLNQLLAPHTQKLNEAIESDAFQRLEIEQQLYAYSGMIFGAYRPQPLFFHAGLSARSIQRGLVQESELPALQGSQDVALARCELPARLPNPALEPVTDLDIIDETSWTLAKTWAEPDRRSKARLSGSLAGYIAAAVRQLYGLSWVEDYDPSTGRRTVRSLVDPEAISEHFVAEAEPYITYYIR